MTNGIQDVALAFEKGRVTSCDRRRAGPDEPVFNRLMLERVLLGGLWMALLAFAAYVLMLEAGVPVPHARNALMLLMVLLQNVDAFNAAPRRSRHSGFRSAAIRSWCAGVTGALLAHVAAMHVPLLQRVLNLSPLPAAEWITLGVVALSLLLVMEIQKISWRRRTRPSAPRQA